MLNMKVTLLCGSRLRRISEDGKTFLDTNMNEGALIEEDTHATLLHEIMSKDKSKIAYIVECKHGGKVLTGWVYQYEFMNHQR